MPHVIAGAKIIVCFRTVLPTFTLYQSSNLTRDYFTPAGAEMMWITYRSLLSTEGFLDMEAHESDLRGSRGVFMAGSLTLFMGVCNMKNTFATLLVKRRWEAWVMADLGWTRPRVHVRSLHRLRLDEEHAVPL